MNKNYKLITTIKKQRELLIEKNTLVRLLYKQGRHIVLGVLKL